MLLLVRTEEASNIRMREQRMNPMSNAGFVRQRHMSLPDSSILQKEGNACNLFELETWIYQRGDIGQPFCF